MAEILPESTLRPAARSDAELIAAALAGDGEAFAAIMRRNNRRLYRLTRGILRNEADAEEAVQDTYLRAFAALATFDGAANLSTWLSRIAINEALARLRRQRAQATFETIETIDREPIDLNRPDDRGATPERTAARTEIRRLIESAIDRLPSHFRVVFIMRALEQQSVEETAAALGIPTATVKTRFPRANRLLRDALSAELAAALGDAFPFAGARCARVTARVLGQIGMAAPAWLGEAEGRSAD
jgi:RNA polymerase sigma-70 factor (ECF subfamily)